MNAASNQTVPGTTFEVRRLNYRRGGRQILFDLSFTVAAHSIFTIIGPSGVGKSSLLRLFNRLDEPPPGTVFFNGQDITGLDVLALRRRVAMLFQKPAMFEGTVRNNLRYGPALLGHQPEEAQVQATLRSLELDSDLLDRDAQALSGGQAQRVALARTLLMEPEVLLLDEPTAALDPTARRKIERLIIDLQQKLSLTVVWVTHDMHQAQRVGEWTLLLLDGRVAEIGQTDHLMAPGSRHERVKAFMAGNIDQQGGEELFYGEPEEE